MFLNESTVVNGGTEYGIVGDEFGMFGIQMEAETSWFNLERKMMRLEHNAVVNEDAQLLEAGVKDFFEQAKKWFMRVVDQVREWFRNMWTQLMDLIVQSEKWLEKNKEALGKAGEVEFEIRYAHLDNVEKLIKGARGDIAVPASFENEDASAAARKALATALGLPADTNELGSAIQKAIYGEKAEKSKNKQNGAGIAADIKKFGDKAKSTKTIADSIAKAGKEAISNAEKARKETKDEARKLAGKQISFQKTVLSGKMTALNAVVTAVRGNVITLVGAGRKAIRGTKKAEDPKKSESVLDLF